MPAPIRAIVDQIMADYDHNGDGALSSRGLAIWKKGDEMQRFNKAYGEDQEDVDGTAPSV